MTGRELFEDDTGAAANMRASCAVVICARNEERTVGQVVAAVRHLVAPASILVVDDSSNDATGPAASAAGAQVVSTARGRSGLGAAMRLGIRSALADPNVSTICTVDADGQYRVSDLNALLALRAESGADLVVGNRLAAGVPTGMRRHRHLANRTFSALFARVASLPAGIDAQSGLRAFGRDLAGTLPLENDFTYTQEQLLLAAMQGAKIIHAPVSFGPRLDGSSRLVASTGDYALRTVPHLLRVAARDAVPRPPVSHGRAVPAPTATS